MVIVKERIYIQDPSEAPEGVDVQEGARGGLYYELSDWGEQVDWEEIEELQEFEEESDVNLNKPIQEGSDKTIGDAFVELWSQFGDKAIQSVLNQLAGGGADMLMQYPMETLRVVATTMGMADKPDTPDMFLKAEWEPYVGPQGGQGWRNTETDEVVYSDTPPGGVSLPDEIPGELDTGVEIEDIQEGDQVLAIQDGEIVLEEAQDLQADADMYGVVREQQEFIDELEQLGDELEDQMDGDEDDEVEEDEVAVNPLGGYLDEMAEENEEENPVESEGDVLIFEVEDHYGLDGSDWDFNPEDAEISEIEGDIKALIPDITDETFSQNGWDSIGDFLREPPSFVTATDIEKVMAVSTGVFGGEDDGEVIDEGEFSYSNAGKVPEGEFVEVTLSSGKVFSGEVTMQEPDSARMRVEHPSGDVEFISYMELRGGEVVDEDDMYREEVPDNPSIDDIKAVLNNEGLWASASLKSEKKEYSSILVEAIEKGGDPYEIGKFAGEQFSSRDLRVVGSYALESVTMKSNVLDEEVPLGNDRDFQAAIDKMTFKTFQDRNPEHQDTIDEVKNIVSSWTGGSQKSETVPFWAVAVEQGEDNVPEQLADQIDDIEDSEVINAVRDYAEFSQEVFRDLFGDSVEVYRGVSGDYGRDRKSQAKKYGETTFDHRAIGSWSLNPVVGKKFSYGTGSLVCQEVDIENIMMGFPNGVGFEDEVEFIASGGVEDYKYTEDIEELGAGSIVSGNDFEEDELTGKFFERIAEYVDN